VSWAVERHAESAATFHARQPDDPPRRAVWVCEPTAPALVLGSAQRPEVVDVAACERAGVAVVRRRSGGGAVLVEPGALLWVDVIVPAGDPLWVGDVGRAFLWLGETWRAALGELGVAASVHDGGLVRGPWSDLVCFAGLGPGELTAPGGAKLVGMSQRRTRAAARFQCAALLRWAPTDLLQLLALDEPTRVAAASELVDAAVGVGVDPGQLLDAFLRRLP
jgi:lipoate-protein ligase A